MKKLQTQLKQLQSSHTLSVSEKADMKTALQEYTKLRPMRVPARGRVSPLSFNILLQHKLLSATLIVILFFSSGAGAVYASTDSLPGERLYTIKSIVEDVHEFVLLSDEDKADFATELTERREQEAQKLEELGELNEVRLAIIDKRVAKHKLRANRILQRLEVHSPDKVSSIRIKMANRTQNIKNIRIKRLNNILIQEMHSIEQEYAEQEQLLSELDSLLQEVETIIHN